MLRATILRVSNTWPPPGPQKREPLLEHIRDVWVLHGIERNCVAGLYRTTFGIELRFHLGDDLIESRLSRYGEAPLQVTVHRRDLRNDFGLRAARREQRRAD
jgi:hypothetical protein